MAKLIELSSVVAGQIGFIVNQDGSIWDDGGCRNLWTLKTKDGWRPHQCFLEGATCTIKVPTDQNLKFLPVELFDNNKLLANQYCVGWKVEGLISQPTRAEPDNHLSFTVLTPTYQQEIHPPYPRNGSHYWQPLGNQQAVSQLFKNHLGHLKELLLRVY